MKPKRPKTVFRHRFDFEIGYLVKSPCRDCKIRNVFPKCMEKCEILERLQTVLAEAVSCTKYG